MDFLKTYIKLVVNQVCIGVGVTRVTATPKPPSNVCGGRLLLPDQCDSLPGTALGGKNFRPNYLLSDSRFVNSERPSSKIIAPGHSPYAMNHPPSIPENTNTISFQRGKIRRPFNQAETLSRYILD